MKSYIGKILRVDLTRGETRVDDLNAEWAGAFIGGKGLGARYLFEELPAGVDPLSPTNVLIFMTGPLTGTAAPASSKIAVVTKSPLTGTFLDCYVGGYLPAELKFAGFDGIVIKGRTDRLSYLAVEDGEAAIRDAQDLAGKGVYETTQAVAEEMGSDDARIAAIGPAGENLVKIACITSELHHQAARGGIGSVMGSKNLKAIGVRGTEREVEVDDPDRFRKTVQEVIKEEILENPAEEWAMTSGTPAIVSMSNDAGILPTRNFQDGVFEGAEAIDETAIKQIRVRKAACYRCPIACRNIVRIRSGPFKGLTLEGPEYETLALTGSNCGISDLGAIAKYNDLCDDLGIDTISAGNATAFAMECFERGLISEEDVGGRDLHFGSIDGYLEVPRLIAYKEGVGALLAEGVRTASEKIGGESRRFALHCKGLEYPGYDPRGSIGMALAYATADRGACHLRSWPADSEAFGDLDPFTIKGKASLVVDEQNKYSVKWSLIFCDFYGVDYPTMTRLYTLATGREADEAKFRLVGERIWNLIRLFSVREGFTRRNDTVPPRITDDPLRSGPAKGHLVPKEDFEAMLSEYYELRGWTSEGVPTREKLEELNLLQFV